MTTLSSCMEGELRMRLHRFALGGTRESRFFPPVELPSFEMSSSMSDAVDSHRVWRRPSKLSRSGLLSMSDSTDSHRVRKDARPFIVGALPRPASPCPSLDKARNIPIASLTRVTVTGSGCGSSVGSRSLSLIESKAALVYSRSARTCASCSLALVHCGCATESATCSKVSGARSTERQGTR